MSMWNYDEEGNPYPSEQRHYYRDPYSSPDDSGSSDYHESYGGHHSPYGLSHNEHMHHHHSHQHDHEHHNHNVQSEASRASPSQQNYESFGNNQAHGQNTTHHQPRRNQDQEQLTSHHNSNENPNYGQNSSIGHSQSPQYGGGIDGYDMSAGYETGQERHVAPPVSTTHHEAADHSDLFTSDTVVNLTLDEIDALVRNHRSTAWLVVLYAPWCRFCQAMEDNFKRVAQHLECSNVYVGRFRADGGYKEYAKRYLQLEHFPTVLFFPKDSSQIVKYQSENREVDALLGFVYAFEYVGVR